MEVIFNFRPTSFLSHTDVPKPVGHLCGHQDKREIIADIHELAAALSTDSSDIVDVAA